jgi:hypothetical protein
VDAMHNVLKESDHMGQTQKNCNKIQLAKLFFPPAMMYWHKSGTVGESINQSNIFQLNFKNDLIQKVLNYLELVNKGNSA